MEEGVRLEPNEVKRLEAAVAQGQRFEFLATHPEWPYFREWMERALAAYDRKAHNPAERGNHVTLARALEGYDAIKSILEGFDGAVQRGQDARRKLDQA